MADYGLTGPCIGHLRVLGWFPGEAFIATDSTEDLAEDVSFASGDILDTTREIQENSAGTARSRPQEFAVD
jgi:hypothetical protein